ncbi:O-antigen ligase family protein [Bacteroides nordii]|uniref:O-antigen ligase family protein n=1 Tax=Bacteroides nordii TaxID=291645 RepID=UPI001899810A|nr:O-antigen ligase family protein [Bacteroides nordii]
MMLDKIKDLRFFFYLIFVFLLPYNNLNLYIGFEIRKVVWFVWIILAIISFKSCFSIKCIKQFLYPLWLQLLFMACIGLYGHLRYFYSTTLFNYEVVLAILFLLMSINELKININRIQKVYNTFIISLGVLSIFAMLGIGLGINNEETGRLTIFGSNANDLGNWAVCAIVFCVYSLLHKCNLIMRIIFIIAIPLLLNLVASSASRGAFIFLLIVLCLFAITTNTTQKYKKMILFILFILIGYLSFIWIMSNELMRDRMISFITEEDTSGRNIIWSIGFSMIVERSICGWGINGYIQEMTTRYGEYRSMHNMFLEYWVTSGIVGLFLLCMFFYRFGRRVIKIRKVDNLPLILYTLVIMIALKTGGVQASLFFWFLISISIALSNSLILKSSK